MNIIARVILKSPLKTIFEGPIGREFLEFNHYYLIAYKSLKQVSIAKKGLGISFFFGIYRKVDLIVNQTQIKNAARLVIIPNPLLIFSWKKIILSKNTNKLVVEIFDLAPNTFSPLSYADHHLTSDTSFSKVKDRMSTLIKDMTFIEKKDCTIGETSIYRSRDNRLWQQWSDQFGKIHLENITQQQWSFDYVEARESKKNSTLNDSQEITPFDRDYYESLEIDPRRRKCQEENCHNISAKGSSLCKNHHFEIITGKIIN